MNNGVSVICAIIIINIYFNDYIYKNNPTQDHNNVLDHFILPASTASTSSITRYPRIVINYYSSE